MAVDRRVETTLFSELEHQKVDAIVLELAEEISYERDAAEVDNAYHLHLQLVSGVELSLPERIDVNENAIISLSRGHSQTTKGEDLFVDFESSCVCIPTFIEWPRLTFQPPLLVIHINNGLLHAPFSFGLSS